MAGRLNKILFRMLLPRGGNFRIKPFLERDWQSGKIKISNTPLRFLFHTPDKSQAPKYSVLLAHPYLSEGRYFFIRSGIADMYRQLSCNVYICDFNGFGRSPFRDFDFEKDLIGTGKHISQMHPDTKVILHGISFGAAQSILACTQEHHPFTGLIIENCLDHNLSYFKVRSRKLYYLLRFLNLLRPESAKKHHYTERITEIKLLSAVLFIYCEADTLTTPDMGRKLYNNTGIPSSMQIFRGGHLEASAHDVSEYRAVLERFLSSLYI
jgi:hypothetical protein